MEINKTGQVKMTMSSNTGTGCTKPDKENNKTS